MLITLGWSKLDGGSSIKHWVDLVGGPVLQIQSSIECIDDKMKINV